MQSSDGKRRMLASIKSPGRFLRSGSYRSALISKFVAVATVPFLVFGVLATSLVTRELQTTATERSQTLADTLAAETESFLNHPQMVLTQVASLLERHTFFDPALAAEFLSIITQSHFPFDAIYVLDQSGQVVLAAPHPDKFLGFSMRRQPFFEKAVASGQVYWAAPFFDLKTGRIILPVGRPFDGGVVAGFVDLALLRSLTQRIHIGSRGFAFITDQSGVVIAHPDEQIVMQRLNAKNLEIVRQGLDGRTGTWIYNYRNERHIGSVQHVGKTGWSVIATQPTSEAFALAIKLGRWLWVGCTAVLAMAIALALWNSAGILRPLLSLARQTRKVADGDYSHLPSITSNYKELNSLAHDFAVMTQAIQNREKEIDGKVQQRTRMLQAQTIDLAQAKQAAEAANRAKSEFLSHMSHELRTPLNSVMGYTQIMQRSDQLSARHKKYLSAILSSSEHLLALINDILDIARIEAGKEEVSAQVFNLTQMLQEVVDAARVQATPKALDFICQTDPRVPANVKGDARKLRQVLLNLLDNAFKFTPAGRVQLRVVPSGADGKRTLLRFEVGDTGIGIAPDQLEAIFEPFTQLSPPGQSPGGTGLGLSISRRLTTLMGGTLSVQSCSGKGSTFTARLPFEMVDTTAGGGKKREVTGYGGPRKKILIVDNDPTHLFQLATLLTPLGFAVERAVSGTEALDKATAGKPDLVLLDLSMPGPDGQDILGALRSNRRLDLLKIIGVSAGETDEEQAASFASACDAVIRKPVNKEELLTRLADQLALEWITPSQAEPGPAAHDVVRPDSEILHQICEKARSGDFGGLEIILNALDADNGNYGAFCQQIRTHMSVYDEEAIIRYIEQLPT